MNQKDRAEEKRKKRIADAERKRSRRVNTRTKKRAAAIASAAGKTVTKMAGVVRDAERILASSDAAYAILDGGKDEVKILRVRDAAREFLKEARQLKTKINRLQAVAIASRHAPLN